MSCTLYNHQEALTWGNDLVGVVWAESTRVAYMKTVSMCSLLQYCTLMGSPEISYVQ